MIHVYKDFNVTYMCVYSIRDGWNCCDHCKINLFPLNFNEKNVNFMDYVSNSIKLKWSINPSILLKKMKSLKFNFNWNFNCELFYPHLYAATIRAQTGNAQSLVYLKGIVTTSRFGLKLPLCNELTVCLTVVHLTILVNDTMTPYCGFMRKT